MSFLIWQSSTEYLSKSQKISMIGQDQKTLTSTFAQFQTVNTKNVFLEGGLITRQCPNSILRFF